MREIKIITDQNSTFFYIYKKLYLILPKKKVCYENYDALFGVVFDQNTDDYNIQEKKNKHLGD